MHSFGFLHVISCDGFELSDLSAHSLQLPVLSCTSFSVFCCLSMKSLDSWKIFSFRVSSRIVLRLSVLSFDFCASAMIPLRLAIAQSNFLILVVWSLMVLWTSVVVDSWQWCWALALTWLMQASKRWSTMLFVDAGRDDNSVCAIRLLRSVLQPFPHPSQIFPRLHWHVFSRSVIVWCVPLDVVARAVPTCYCYYYLNLLLGRPWLRR